jgi:hypothetical protein
MSGARNCAVVPADDPFTANLISAVERNSGTTRDEMRSSRIRAELLRRAGDLHDPWLLHQRALADTPLAAGTMQSAPGAAADFCAAGVPGNEPIPVAWLRAL